MDAKNDDARNYVIEQYGGFKPFNLDQKASYLKLVKLFDSYYLKGMKDPSVVALVEFLKKLIKESLYYPNPAETMGSFVECRHCRGGIKTTYRDGAWRFDELSKPITHANDCPIGDINEVLAQYHAATKEEGK